MRSTIGLLTALVIIGFSAAPRAEASNTPEAQFIASVADEVVSAFRDELPTADRRDAFEALVTDAIDLDTLVPYATGDYWTAATDGERRELKSAFMGYAVRTYADFLLDAFVKDYKITSVSELDNGAVKVDTQVTRKFEQRRPTYAWTVVGYGNGVYKVLDVAEAGFSLAETLRSDCHAILKEYGIKGLIKALDEATNAR